MGYRPGIPDGTGPYGAGRGPGKGRADGSGMKFAPTRFYTANYSVMGPGGNFPDGKGSKGFGRGKGPGRGFEDGSGLETIANTARNRRRKTPSKPGAGYTLMHGNYVPNNTKYKHLDMTELAGKLPRGSNVKYNAVSRPRSCER